MLKALGSGVRRFSRNARGNVAVLFGLAIIPIILGIGVAVDYGRALIVRERMASAADSAALAIGSWTDLSQAQLKTKAQQYFDANYASTFGKASALDVSFQGDDILVKVSGTVPTTFMRLANINSVDVGASAIISKKERNIELALVLDTTGSMGQGGKMSAMQSAAKEMVKDLFNGDSTSDTLKIAVVPFSAAVNVGSDKASEAWIDSKAKSAVSYEDFKSGVKTFSLYSALQNRSWQGCVREREGSAYELTDEPPSGTAASLFAPYFAPDEPDSDHNNGASYANNYIDDGDCGQSKSKNRTPDNCQRYTDKYNNAFASSISKGPQYNCPPRAITDLTNKQSQVISAIDQLAPEGSTVIPAGLLWGWRVLSPTEPFTTAKPYDDDKLVKAIVLLTDGENSVNGGGNGHNKSVYNAFGYASEGHLGNTNGSNAEATLDTKTATVCSAIKAKGILIYTIGFQITDSTTKNLLKNCASQPDMYYNSPSNAQLASIFKDIAQGLSDLRIAQ